MQVVEETLGYEHLLRYLSQMREEYEAPRSRAAPPLLRANNRFMYYRKGPFALFALRNYIGKDRVNNALRRILRDYPPKPPLPTTLDFYRELQAVTPDSLHYLLHDLFAANTFWEFETEQAKARQTQTGAWQVTLEVKARKVTVDETGAETLLPMNDWVEVGVYGPTGKGKESRQPLYLLKHRIRSGKQIIKVIVSGKPSRAGIDPNHLLIDLKMDDNTERVKGLKQGMVIQRCPISGSCLPASKGIENRSKKKSKMEIVGESGFSADYSRERFLFLYSHINQSAMIKETNPMIPPVAFRIISSTSNCPILNMR
jgi:hypothetical protein